MKRRRSGGGAAPQPEACDVWLDTAELKQGPVQSLAVKTKVPRPVLERFLGSVSFTQTGASRPRTKQTTISTFFRTQTDESLSNSSHSQSSLESNLNLNQGTRLYFLQHWERQNIQLWLSNGDEEDKENSRPSPFILSKDCKEEGNSLAACPVKILALPRLEEAQKRSCRAGEGLVQVTPQRHMQTAPASPTPSPGSWLLRAESHSTSGLGEDCCCFSFTWDSEGSRIIAHRHKSDLFDGKRVLESSGRTAECGISKQEAQPLPEEAKTRLDFQPGLGANQSQKPHGSSSVNSLTDFSETETVNPALTRGSTRAAGLYLSPQKAARAQPLRECSLSAGGTGSATELWGSPCRQLFTQDSEGNRVIAHRCQNVPSPCKDQGSSRGQMPNSPGKCGSLCQFDLCYDFTVHPGFGREQGD